MVWQRTHFWAANPSFNARLAFNLWSVMSFVEYLSEKFPKNKIYFALKQIIELSITSTNGLHCFSRVLLRNSNKQIVRSEGLQLKSETYLNQTIAKHDFANIVFRTLGFVNRLTLGLNYSNAIMNWNWISKWNRIELELIRIVNCLMQIERPKWK